MHNIAEGFDAGTNLEFIRFLKIARRSASEVQSELYLALDRNYINQDELSLAYNLATETKRLINVTLDDASIGRGNADQEHERSIAIYDLIEDNSFSLPGHDGGPYQLNIGLHDSKLALNILDEAGDAIVMHILSLQPFRRISKDYFR